MILLYGFLGLGLSEIVIIVVAVLFLLGPNNVKFIKPFVKQAYKMWLSYQKDVVEAENEMEELKKTALQPIQDAEKEVENELRHQTEDLHLDEVKEQLQKAGKQFEDVKGVVGKFRSKAQPSSPANAPNQPGMKNRPGMGNAAMPAGRNQQLMQQAGMPGQNAQQGRFSGFMQNRQAIQQKAQASGTPQLSALPASTPQQKPQVPAAPQPSMQKSEPVQVSKPKANAQPAVKPAASTAKQAETINPIKEIADEIKKEPKSKKQSSARKQKKKGKGKKS